MSAPRITENRPGDAALFSRFIHKYGIDAFAAGAELQPVIYLSRVRTSNRVQHFHNINARVDGNTHHTRPYDKACDI